MTLGGGSWGDATSLTQKTANDSFLMGTGVTEYTNRNNIYDLAGNCFEWTTEAHSSGDVVIRGGDFEGNGSNCPAGDRGYYGAGYSVGSQSFRPALYINVN